MAKSESRPLHGKIVYTERQIDKRECELAEQIDAMFDVDELVLIGLLTGATRVMHDLLANLSKIRPKANPVYDFMRISNYKDGVRASEPRLLSDISPQTEIEDRHALLVDGISDSGGSNRLAKKHVISLGAASVTEYVLVNRVFGEQKENFPEIAGFDYNDWKYLVGRGFDGPGAGPGGGRAFPFVAECSIQPEAAKYDNADN